MQPDRLGEDHVAATVQREPTVATQPAGSATEPQLRQAITVLGRGLPRHPDLAQPAEKRTMTVGAVLIDLDARTMHVANGPPCCNDYVAFKVEDDDD